MLCPVIVCHCKAVSDHAIREAVREGARSCRQVGRACQAGRTCGGCRPLIREIIETESEPLPLFPSLEELATG
jgi:bacterioferritin-associated ferredoxin